MKYFFKAFGLNIQSEFPFQGIEIPEKGFFDIDVIEGEIPTELTNTKHKGLSFESNETEFLLKIPNVATFLIKEGNKIIISRGSEVENREIELFFLGSAMAVILMQRGIIPFHGSAFEKNGKCIIISGKSGAGKSTLLRYFLNEGYKALTDDVCALSMNNNKITITPSYPSSKIWEDIMKKYNLEKNNTNQVRPDIKKYKQSFENNFCNQILEVESIYILKSKNSEIFSHEQITGFEKFKQLKANLYRPKFPEAIGKEKETFIILNQLANQANLYYLTRSTSIDLLEKFNEYAKSVIIEK